MLSKIPFTMLRIIQITVRKAPSMLFEKRNTLLEMLVDARMHRGMLSNDPKEAFKFTNSFDIVCEIVAKFYCLIRQISSRAEV